jgi:GH15 family glucan-1,4-alpha-glucosidase
MSWVASSGDPDGRAARPAGDHRWTSSRDEIYRQIMDRGLERSGEAFVQHYGTTCSTRRCC